MIALLPAALAMALVMGFAWVWQRRTGNAGWVDVFWTFGLGAAGVAVALSAGRGPRGVVVAVLVAVWASRLGLYLVARTRRGPEDARYARFRRDWGDRFESRLFAFLLIQAAAAALLLPPVALAASSPRPPGWPDAAAVAILVVAVTGEHLSDRQMHAFRGVPENHGKVCDFGLWGLSRHPNYFFEWLHWLAYPVLAIGAPWGWVALIGPAFMYVLLVHVSGIPPLEAQMLRSRGEAYRRYQARVSAFIPWPKGSTP
jgi:steroid 5-alpha reductase family enzyme